MKQFGLNQINDIKLQQLDFYPNSNDIFEDVAIGDGISIVFKNKNKTTSGFIYNYHKDGNITSVQMDSPGEELIPLNPNDGLITDKVNQFVNNYNLSWMHDRILPRNLFNIESNFVEENPNLVREFNDLSELNSNEIKLLTNDKAGKAGRAKWFIVDKSVIKTNNDKINQWQVVVSSANAGGQKRDNQIEIIDNKSAFGRSRVALATFKTYEEARNFYDYANTYLIRFMFLMTDEALTSLGKKVPDILNYKSTNQLIDFSKDLNDQLYNLVNLSKDEITYVENVINNLR